MRQYSKKLGNMGAPEQDSNPIYSSLWETFLTFLGLGCSVLPLPVVYYSNSLVSLINLSSYRVNDTNGLYY